MLALILSDSESVLILLGSQVLSSGKLLESSKLEPKLESEHEIKCDLLLPPTFSKLLGGLLKGSVELVMETLGRHMFGSVDAAVILKLTRHP